MENCSRPNSGTVSRIQFKLGTGIDHQVASRDVTPSSKDQRSKSQRHVTYPVKNRNNWVDVSSSHLEANMRTTPQRVALKMVAMVAKVAKERGH